MTTKKDPACGNEPRMPARTGNTPAASVIRNLPLATLKPHIGNPRRHGDKQLDLIARSIREFGFVNPVLIDKDNAIVAGHGRYEAARRLGLATVPTVLLEHLTDAQVRAYRIADNRIAELSDWDADLLRLEIVDLSDLEFRGELDFDLSLTGFDTPELDIILEGKAEGEAEAEQVELPDAKTPAVTRPGDLWILDEHRLLCGDALRDESYARLMQGELARMVFTDPPYNVPIGGNVRAGTSGHREFAMGVGELIGSPIAFV